MLLDARRAAERTIWSIEHGPAILVFQRRPGKLPTRPGRRQRDTEIARAVTDVEDARRAAPCFRTPAPARFVVTSLQRGIGARVRAIERAHRALC